MKIKTPRIMRIVKVDTWLNSSFPKAILKNPNKKNMLGIQTGVRLPNLDLNIFSLFSFSRFQSNFYTLFLDLFY